MQQGLTTSGTFGTPVRSRKNLAYKRSVYSGRIYHTFSIPFDPSPNLGGLGAPTNRVEGLVLGIPRGGAFILSPVAPNGIYTNAINSAIGGKNVRGFGAVDLVLGQNTNDAATMVASGAYSFLAGGYSNTASGPAAVVVGGSGNNAATASSVILGGAGNAVSGNFQGCVINGYSCTSSGYNTLAMGYGGSASRINQFAYGAAVGYGGAVSFYHQHSYFALGGKTTDATPLILLATRGENAATGRLTVTIGTVMTCVFNITGHKSDGSAMCRYQRSASFKNIAAVVTMPQTPQLIAVDYEDNVLTDIAITADDTNDAVQVSVTGITGETWRWTCSVQFDESPFGS